jgi:hypothetical protein
MAKKATASFSRTTTKKMFLSTPPHWSVQGEGQKVKYDTQSDPRNGKIAVGAIAMA